MSPHRVDARAAQLFADSEHIAASKLDRIFAALFLVQWLLAIAYVWSSSGRPDDLFTAIVIGAGIATVPTTLVVWKPGTQATRHAIAVAQMLYGTLIVALTGGKLGTPYHVFASLAFLALYRDWRVMLTASSVVVFDTVGVGFISSEVAPWRWVAHLGWVAFADACLIVACRRGNEDLHTLARRKARLEELVANMSHEIRTPMTAILGAADLLLDGDRKSANPSQVQRIRRNGLELLAVLDGIDGIEDPSLVAANDDNREDSTKVVAAEVKSTPTPPRRFECSVLVAEDGIDTQKIVTAHLTRAGVTVTTAENGQVALDKVAAAVAEGKPFDLILMDMQMPVLDGYAATTELRRRGYGGPIIALTARVLSGDRTRCIEAGCTDYLAKPVTRDALVQAVATHALGSAPTMRPSAIAAAVSVANDRSLFSDLVDEDGMQELLDGFVVRLRESVAELEAAFGQHDIPELDRLSHRLRGAAGSFGFPTISRAASELEDAIRANEDIAEKLRSVAALCRRARSRRLVAHAA